MLTFIITTSTKLASISLYEDDNMLANININVRKTHSTSILEQVKSIFSWSEKKLEDVDNLIISSGPGSFTGVRIAMSLVKGLFALSNIRVYSVNELDALYYNAKQYSNFIVSAIDSRKGKIYYNIYENDKKLVDDSIGHIEDVVEFCNAQNNKIVFAGDIVTNYETILKKCKNMLEIPAYKLQIDTRTYYEMYKNGILKEESIENIVPYYLEKSQAEKDYKGEI